MSVSFLLNEKKQKKKHEFALIFCVSFHIPKYAIIFSNTNVHPFICLLLSFFSYSTYCMQKEKKRS